MKAKLILRNTGNNISARVDLSISYFTRENGVEKISSQLIPLTLSSSEDQALTIDFGTFIINDDRDIFILFKKPEGNTVTQQNFTFEELDNSSGGSALLIEVPLNLESELGLADEVLEIIEPNFVYGRLLDINGVRSMEDIQIIIMGRETSVDELKPISSVRTEAKGYFSLDYPAGVFSEVFAQVGVSLTVNPVPVRLDESIPVDGVESSLVFPKRMLLVVEILAEAGSELADNDDECGCNSIDFDKKRILEEYSHFSLVRTSEPAISGYVIPDEEDFLTLEDVLAQLPINKVEITSRLKKIVFFSQTSAVGRTDSVTTAVAPGIAISRAEDGFQSAIKKIKFKKSVLNSFIKDKKGLRANNIEELLQYNESSNFDDFIVSHHPDSMPLGRVELDSNNIVDWDFKPKIYQAVEVAHGHILQYKSEFCDDGHGLGQLLYSLPLAPGQKKQIVVFDWERREAIANSQEIDFEESLSHSLSRDRDIQEIAAGMVAETVSGKSAATTASIGGGLFGGFFGIAGGVGHARSTASQNSLRNVSSSDHQKLKDKVLQSTNAVRSLRSTVVQTVAQGERFEVSAESVANYNHCHAITIQYYEVLRHLKVKQRFAGARECLFVPLLMSSFDLEKALRWKEPLKAGLLDKSLSKAFDASDRIAHRWEEDDFPGGTFASENIISANGYLKIKFQFERPADKFELEDDIERGPISVFEGRAIYHKIKVAQFVEENWKPFESVVGTNTAEFFENNIKYAKDKDSVFHKMLGEDIVRKILEKMIFSVLNEAGEVLKVLTIDTTLTSRYQRNGKMTISLRLGATDIKREDFNYLKVSIELNNNETLPPNIAIIHSGLMRYKTEHFEDYLFRYQYIGDDISGSDSAVIYTRPSNKELSDPRQEDVILSNQLIAHLNNNLEYFHKVLWMNMSAERRFMLLDGIILNGKGQGRSVASLVENELLTIIGNSLVFPVAPGLNLNPDFGANQSLNEFYQVSASEPINISIPTKGVYAESVMGQCNACEEKDESRFWRWEESPIPDSPTTINPINTDSRNQPAALHTSALPGSSINIQTPQNAPDPTGIAGVLGLLANSDLFNDITGLSENQKNSIAALQASLSSAEVLAKEGAKLEVQKEMEKRLDTALSKIDSSGLSEEKRNELKEKAINAFIGAGATKDEKSDSSSKKTAKTAEEKSAAKAQAAAAKKQVELKAKAASATKLSEKLKNALIKAEKNSVNAQNALVEATADSNTTSDELAVFVAAEASTSEINNKAAAAAKKGTAAAATADAAVAESIAAKELKEAEAAREKATKAEEAAIAEEKEAQEAKDAAALAATLAETLNA